MFLSSLWSFLGSYQSKTIRANHIVLVILVIIQIIISNGMHFISSKNLGSGYSLYFNLLHIFIGCFLFLLMISLIYFCFKENGFFNYYPYLMGELTQIKHDLNQIMHLQLPDSNPKGIASAVQGAGLFALFMVILSGLIWLIFWSFGNYQFANKAEQIHKSLTGLIEIYIAGHGGMALLHFLKWKKLN